MALRLLIDRPGAAALDRLFETDEVVVGRSKDADLTVDDSSVSRRHARFYRADDVWFVEDLGSRNGTELNGRRVAGAERVGSGDVVAVGSVRLRIGDGPDASSPKPTDVEQETASPIGHDTLFSVLKPAADLMPDRTSQVLASSRLKVLIDVHRALSSPIDRAKLLEIVLDRAFGLVQPEQAAIFLVGADGRLALAAERRAPSAKGGLLLSSRLADEVTGKGRAALVLDAQSDERFAAAGSILASGVRSILAAPLSDPEGCLGMIALYSRIHVRRFSEQDLEILVSLASAAALRIRNIDLAEAATRRRVLDRELALAQEIQAGMLSRRPPVRDEVTLAARLVPARSVGGDFYDFVLDGDRLWFVVADVAGKGMGAALMMAVALTLFRAIAPGQSNVDELLGRLNRELARDNDRAMFVTALSGCMDLASGRVHLANAGHNLPYHLRTDGTVEKLALTNGMALGVVEDTHFPLTDVLLAPGDGLFCYTDGVCDAVDRTGRAFGTPGLEACLREVARRAPADIVGEVFAAVEAFAGAAPQEDDITVAVLRRA